jgi:hypothetical protein
MIGVACPRQPNITTCGRIGIAVWLKRPAIAAIADLAGAHIRLHAGGFGGKRPTYWEGYVRRSRQQLGLPVQWYGTKPVKFLRLHLVIRYTARVAKVTVRLQLRPGWG